MIDKHQHDPESGFSIVVWVGIKSVASFLVRGTGGKLLKPNLLARGTVAGSVSSETFR
jgi:hypothetical protein